jgi:hypothetical protein
VQLCAWLQRCLPAYPLPLLAARSMAEAFWAAFWALAAENVRSCYM